MMVFWYAVSHLWFNKDNNTFQWCSSGWKHYQHIIMEPLWWQNGCLFTFLSANNKHKMIVCPYVWKLSKAYGNGLATVCSMVIYTIYTKYKFTFGQLNLRLGLYNYPYTTLLLLEQINPEWTGLLLIQVSKVCFTFTQSLKVTLQGYPFQDVLGYW